MQVSPAGGWSMPNVPSNLGRVRARATCIQNNQTVSGILIDGSTADLTRKSSGTTYGSGNLTIASFGSQDGEVFAGQAGR